MDSGFNLDPDAYSIQELRDLLSLKDGDGEQEVRTARATINAQLAGQPGVSPDRINSIGLFLDTVFSRICNSLGGQPASVPLADSAQGTWGQELTPITQQGSNILITSPDELAGRNASITGGRAATSGDAPPGYLNPINVRTLMQAVNLDSRFRPNYFTTRSTDFTVMLPEEIKKVVSMRVASIQLPLTYYSISESQGNAHMLLISSQPAGGPREALLVRVPDGNYEPYWSPQADSAGIEKAINQAVAYGTLGTVDAQGLFNPTNPIPGPPPPSCCEAPDLGPSPVFAVDQPSGRSVLFPQGSINYPGGGSTQLVRFNVDSKGNLDTSTNLQLRLGWALGSGRRSTPSPLARTAGRTATRAP